jgi:hypothetical protein
MRSQENIMRCSAPERLSYGVCVPEEVLEWKALTWNMTPDTRYH